MTKLQTELTKLRACSQAVSWCGQRTAAQAWQECDKADWLLWLAARTLPHSLVVLAACACARTALSHVPAGEERPRLAIEAAERWAKEPTAENKVLLQKARTDVAAYIAAAAAWATAHATAYATAATANDTYAAHITALATAYAAHATAHATAYAAHATATDATDVATYSAAKAAYAAAAAAYAYGAAYAAYADGEAAKEKAHSEMCALIRELLPQPAFQE
jgi:hypothetical protein